MDGSYQVDAAAVIDRLKVHIGEQAARIAALEVRVQEMTQEIRQHEAASHTADQLPKV